MSTRIVAMLKWDGCDKSDNNKVCSTLKAKNHLHLFQFKTCMKYDFLLGTMIVMTLNVVLDIECCIGQC